MDDFCAVLQRCVINKDNEDRWEWIGSVDKKYNVKHTYSIISQGGVGGCEDAFKLLWNTKGQP